MMTTGVVLFVAAPTSAFILALHAARAGHRSGRIAVMVSGLLLLATIVCMLLYGGWIGLAVTAAVAALVLAGCASTGWSMVPAALTEGVDHARQT
jgi:MFS family permease